MFIQPIDNLIGINELKGLASSQPEKKAGGSFESILQDAIGNVEATAKQTERNSMALATGQLDDLHNITIDIAKAQLSMQLLVQLRNKSMEVYTEMMRMNV